MSAFDDLKKKAETTLATDESKAKGWISTHKAMLIAIGVSFALGFIVAKAFAG